MVRLLRYIIFIFFLTPALAQGTEYFGLIESTEKPIYLNSSAVYYEDVNSDKDLDILRCLNQSYFKPLDSLKLKDNKSDLWVKFSLSNQSINKQFVLKLASWQYGDYIDIYITQKDSLLTHSKSGYFAKRNEIDLAYFNQESKSSLFLPTYDTLLIFIKYKTLSGFGSKPNLILVKEQEIFNIVRIKGMIHGVFQGLLWLIALLALTFFIFLKERVFLYYFLYISFISLYFFGKDGYLFELILPNNPVLANLLYAAASMISSSFFLLFIRQIIINKKELRFWIKGNLIVFFMFFTMAIISVFFLASENIKVSFYLINFTLLFSAVYLYPFIFKFSRQKDLVSKYAFIATSVMILFFTVGLTSLQFNINVGEISSYSFMKIGVSIELILFNIALAYSQYQKELETRRTKENLIEQLKVNQVIKDEMNANLEKQVALRTQELECQKAETEAQRDDIFSKNIILQDKNEEISSQKETIEKNHKLLTDSLNYARLIQTSIIPDIEKFEKVFSEFFVLSKPKDVVSGDFYWINTEENKVHIAVADCTGHGVPGAMLSVLGITSLDKIVQNQTNIEPNATLEYLRNDFIAMLHQENEQVGKEGIDMLLCNIDFEKDELTFSSAHQPAIIIRNKEIIRLKASNQPIGRYLKETPFKNDIYSLEDNDMIYLFTDGYFDQLGGTEGKKFMSRRFKNILIKIHALPCKDQKKKLNGILQRWKGSNEQTDDVTVLGIRYHKQKNS